MSAVRPTPSVMVVEDNNEDFFVLQRLVRREIASAGLQWFNNVDRALAYIESLDQGPTPLPTAIILDLNLPDRDGREVLKTVRQRPQWHKVPVLVFTSVDNSDVKEWCRSHGAYAYQVKGSDTQCFKSLIENLKGIWGSSAYAAAS